MGKAAGATTVFSSAWSCFSPLPTYFSPFPICFSTPPILETPLSQLVCRHHQYGTYDHRHRRVRSMAELDLSLSLTPAALKNGVFAMTLPTLQVLEQLLLGSLKLSKTPVPRNACPLILLHGDTTTAIAIMPPNVSKSSIIISRRKSTSRRWRNRALSSTPLQDLRTFLDFLGLSSSSLRFSSSF